MMTLSIDHRQGIVRPCKWICFKNFKVAARQSKDLTSCRPIVCICARAECISPFRDHQAHVSRCFWTSSDPVLSSKQRGSMSSPFRHGRADTYTPQWRGAAGLWNKFRGYLTNHPSLNCGFSNGFSFKPRACFFRRIAAFSLCSVRSLCPCSPRL